MLDHLCLKDRGDAVFASTDGFGYRIREEKVIHSGLIGISRSTLQHGLERLVEHLTPHNGFKLLTRVGNFCIFLGGIFAGRGF